MSDGAAAVLIGRRSAVEALGLPVLGVLRASAVVGVPPDVMGIGPAYAIPAALQQAGRKCLYADVSSFRLRFMKDVINPEIFVPVSLACFLQVPASS